MLLISIDDKKFNNKVDIKFNNILQGFDKYINGILQEELDYEEHMVEERMITFFQKLVELNGEEDSFIDFYYLTLSEEDKVRLQDILIEEDKEMIKSIEEQSKDRGVYFKLTREMVPFITRLCTREVLFSTFYFTKIPCTIWGNYNKRFPCFFNNKEDLEFYNDISKRFKLQII